MTDDLSLSEQKLKSFNEKNRQISSPSLQLELDRLTREVEVQKNVYLTLKQQLELAKIEEVQEASIVKILDAPQISLGPSNKNIKLSVFLSLSVGILFGVFFGLARAYINNSDVTERRKLRRVRNFINKKSRDFILDTRFSGTILGMLIIGLPFYLGHKSENPIYFGMYSKKLMLVNSFYVITIIFFFFFFLYGRGKRKENL